MPTGIDLERLRIQLPAEGQCLLHGDERAATELALAFGDRFVRTEGEPAHEIPASRFAAAIALLDRADGPSVAEIINRLAARLDLGARLLLLPGTAASSLAGAPFRGGQELVIALSAAGFVVLREEPDLLVARREPFVVREFRDGDEALILPLFARSFHVERSAATFRWIYQSNPHGNRRISLAFAEDGALVAQYAGYPARFHRELGEGGSESLFALHVGDTMTEPSVRSVGRGATSLLGRTVRHFYASYCEERVAFNYGVNTGNIQRFSMSFVGARRLEEVPYRWRDARAPVPRTWRARLRGYRVVRQRAVDARFDELFERVRRQYGLLVARDSAYLDWRYLGRPDSDYTLWAVWRRDRLLGWSVFRRRGENGERLAWGDALFDPAEPEAIDALFAGALAAAEHRGIEAVETWSPARPAWWAERIGGLGFESRPEPQGLGVVFVPFLVDPEEMFLRQWYYTMGDFDLF